MKITPTIDRQAIFLWGVDSISNLADYGFHFFIANNLSPGDFADVQTVNSLLVIFSTAFAVMQPVVARFIAEYIPSTKPLTQLDGEYSRGSSGVFQKAFRLATIIGCALTGITWIISQPLSRWLNVPQFAVIVLAIMLTLILWRPIVAGVLQGEQRFLAYGAVRASQAFGRLIGGVTLISLGAGFVGAIIALPMGVFIAILTGLLLLGFSVWRPGITLPPALLARGVRLSGYALLAYFAYMSLTNLDLIWINRHFSPEIAGGYATAVVLRRVLAVFPGAVLVILYPRIITRVKQNLSLAPLLSKAMVAVSGSTILLTGLYLVFGPEIISFTFGERYIAVAAPLLGVMGLAMTGYGIGAIWLNVFLATRPSPYVGLLVITALSQSILLTIFHRTLNQIMMIFTGGGWILAIGGLVLYLIWLRPKISST